MYQCGVFLDQGLVTSVLVDVFDLFFWKFNMVDINNWFIKVTLGRTYTRSAEKRWSLELQSS